MELFLLKLLNLSITASYLILAVIIVRFILKNAPKKIICMLWGLVAVRLLVPFSIESILSLIPRITLVTNYFSLPGSPQINNISQFNNLNPINNLGSLNNLSPLNNLNHLNNPLKGNPVVSLIPPSTTPESISPMQFFLLVAFIIWLIGVLTLLIYSIITYIKLKNNVATAIPMEGNVYQCDNIDTPFVLGLLRPRIYLPFSLSENNYTYVIAHERAHIKRLDHWIKPFGFLLLTVHWFNPLVWIAFSLLCRDIELACDERVIHQIGIREKKAYSSTLLLCSTTHRNQFMFPLAFGEVGVKQRVKNILNYKKPTIWFVIITILVLIVLALCFLTNPVEKLPLNNSKVDTNISNNGMQVEPTKVPKSNSNEQLFSTKSKDGSIIINTTTTKENNQNKIKEISVIVNGVTLYTDNHIVGYYDDITLDTSTSFAVIKYYGRKWRNFSLLDITNGQFIYDEPFSFADIKLAFHKNNMLNYEINDNDVIAFYCDKILSNDSIIINYQIHDMNGNLQSGKFKYIISKHIFEDLQENKPRTEG